MKNTQLAKRCRNLILLGLAAAAVAAIICVLGYRGIGLDCLFRRVTGLLCPGCGNTRAVLALLRLDIRAALSYNLMFPVEFFYLGWVIFHCGKTYLHQGRFSYRPPKPWMDVAVLVAILIWWVVRNL